MQYSQNHNRYWKISKKNLLEIYELEVDNILLDGKIVHILFKIIKRYENANIYRFLKANHLRIKLGKRLKHLNILVR